MNTLKDIKCRTNGTYCLNEDVWKENYICIDCLKDETIKCLKEAEKEWVTDSPENNAHFVIAKWKEFMNISNEDLK